MKRRLLAWMLCAALLLSGTAFAVPEAETDGETPSAAAEEFSAEVPESGTGPSGEETRETEPQPSAEAEVPPAEEEEPPVEAAERPEEEPVEEPSPERQLAAARRREAEGGTPEGTDCQPAGDLPLDAANPARKPITELPEADFVEGRLLVKLEQRVSLLSDGDPFEGIARRVDHILTVEESAGDVMLAGMEPSAADWYCLELKRGLGMLEAWNRLLAVDGVLCVEPDYLMHADAAKEVTKYDPLLHAQTWLDRINAPAAWAAGGDGASIVVAVVDSGVDLDHPDLQGRLLEGYDFVDGDQQPDDREGHGTHVAGIIAAEQNEIGVRGVAPKAKILPVRVLDDEGSGSTSDIADAIAWAAGATIEGVDSVETRADVINLSLGGFNQSQLRQNAIDFARSKGCLVVASAGNEYLPTTYAGDNFYGASAQPAGAAGVLTVMAMDEAAADNGDWLADFSNYDADPGTGAEYEIMAPGVNILSTTIDGGYESMNGTSMACPIVAGSAAALMSMGCTAAEAWELLVGTGEMRQGRTQPDGAVRSYPALDLGAAAEAKKSGSTAYQYAPAVANAELELALTIDDVGHGKVDFGGINTTSWVYYLEEMYSDEILASSLAVTFENFGGSGDVRITGTVGGVPVVPVTKHLTAGAVETVELELDDLPESENGYVEFLLYANGEKILEDSRMAVNLRTPDMTDAFDRVSKKYRPTDTSVSLQGDTERTTVYVLDSDLEIPLGYYVEIGRTTGQKQLILYQDEGAEIIGNYNAPQASVLLMANVVALAAERFTVSGYGDMELWYCMIYDPWIEWVDYCGECFFWSQGLTAWVQGLWVELCSFTDFFGLTVDCGYFNRNLVNRCAYTDVGAATQAEGNTFVENYYYEEADSILNVFVPDAGWSGGNHKGLWNSSFIGPANFYYQEDQDWTTSPALVRNVYLQEADDPDLTFEQDWYYDTASAISSSPSAFADESPAFFTDVDVEYEYDSTYGAVNYTLTYTLSTPISSYSAPYVDSYADAMTDNAKVTVSNDRKTITVELTAMMTDPEMVNDYSLCGIYTADYYEGGKRIYDFWATELVGQICSAPIALQSMRLETVEAELQTGGYIDLSWDDERLLSGDGVDIERAVDGGEPERMAYNLYGTKQLDDPEIEPGHAYEYTVYILRNGERRFYGTVSCVYPAETFHGGEDLTVAASGDATTVSLNSPWMAGGEGVLTYTLPAAAAAKIEFSEQVQRSGLCYGAVDNGDGTVTVTIGLPEESAVLAKGSLFTLTAENGADCRMAGDDLVCLTDGVLQLWHLAEERTAAAGYAAGGRMTDVVIADVWGETCTLKAADKWKLIFPDANWLPTGQAQEF